MKVPATFLFWIGCIIIVLSAVLQLMFPYFPSLLFIAAGVVLCIRQWYSYTGELKSILKQEREARHSAERYINESLSPRTQQRKKKR